MPRHAQSLAVTKPVIKKLSPDERAFVRAYVECKYNGTKAMQTLDPTLDPVLAQRIGSRYMSKARVRRAVDKRIGNVQHIAGPREVMAELSDVATAHWRDFAKAQDVRTVTRQVTVRVTDPDNPDRTFLTSIEVPVEEHAYFLTNPTPKVKALETLAKIHRLDRDPLLERLEKMTGRMLDQLESGRQDQLLREHEHSEQESARQSDSPGIVDAQLALPAGDPDDQGDEFPAPISASEPELPQGDD